VAGSRRPRFGVASIVAFTVLPVAVLGLKGTVKIFVVRRYQEAVIGAASIDLDGYISHDAVLSGSAASEFCG
jgi:hypothetical protein